MSHAYAERLRTAGSVSKDELLQINRRRGMSFGGLLPQRENTWERFNRYDEKLKVQFSSIRCAIDAARDGIKEGLMFNESGHLSHLDHIETEIEKLRTSLCLGTEK